MLTGRYTNSNSLTHTDTHQISGATGSKATNSRHLIEAGRDHRMSWACQMPSLATENVTHTSEPMGHHYPIDAWRTRSRSPSPVTLLLHPSLPLFRPFFHYQWDTWLLTAAMHPGSHKKQVKINILQTHAFGLRIGRALMEKRREKKGDARERRGRQWQSVCVCVWS